MRFVLSFAIASLTLASNIGCEKALKDEKPGVVKKDDKAEGDKAGDDKADKAAAAKGDKKAKGKTPVAAKSEVMTVAKALTDARAGKKFPGNVEFEVFVDSVVRIANRPAVRIVDEKDGKEAVSAYTVEKAPWDKVVAGQKVKLSGKVSVNPVGFQLEEAVLTVFEKAPTVTVDALAKENTADNEKAMAKYGGKGWIVSGVIDEIDGEKVTLKGDGKTKVWFQISPDQEGLADSLKAGAAIRINAKIDAAGIQPDEIALTKPFVIN